MVLQSVPQNSLLFSSWLAEQGIQRKEQTCYVKSGWLERISQGVYKVAGGKPTLYSALHSYSTQLSKKYNIGALTALALRGFAHFGVVGREKAFLLTSASERFPSWLLSHQWDMDIVYSTTSVFRGSMTGIEEMDYNGFKLQVSSAERAIMECLLLAPTEMSYLDVYYIMEMLTTLRPKQVQSLLEVCTSIKVKRTFLYMAEKAGHQWFKALQLDKISLGSGTRQLAPNGKLISKYSIILPQELVDYE